MSLYRPVRVEFWKDPKVVEEMTPEDKLFFLYLLTNPSTTQIGIYRITKKQMAFDLGYSIESVACILDRFINIHKVIRYNEKTREVAIKNWGKHGFNRLGKPVLDCVKSELKKVDDVSLIEYVLNSISNDSLASLYKAYINKDYNFYDTSTIGGQEKKEEKEEEKEKELLNGNFMLKNRCESFKDNDFGGYKYGRYNESDSKCKYARVSKVKNEKSFEKPSERELEYARNL